MLPSARCTVPGRASLIVRTVAAALICAASVLVWSQLRPAAASSYAPTVPSAARATAVDDLSWADGLALGVVEGITEYLPVSSTGHLVVTERFLDLDPPDREGKDALDSYTVVIQVGAILAVLLLYRRRVRQIISGVAGHNQTGRRLLLGIVIAFVPAGILAKAFEGPISDHLLSPGPVAVAWLVGGVLLLIGSGWLRRTGRHGVALEELTLRHACIIGAAQAFSLWPGVSRSLVTIVGGVAAGLTMAAAVEFSFLLGLATLSAATLYEIVTNGSSIIERYGVTAPLIGIIAAFVAAAAAVNLFVEYLNRRDLRIFGAYRVVAAVVVFIMLGANVI